MRRVRLWSAVILASIAVTTACVPDEPSSASCPAITTITSVQVLLPPGAAPRKNSYLVTDPAAVSRLVAFVNVRRSIAPPSADTPPSPRVRATFFDGGHHVAIFGSGPGVFYFQCGTVRGTRAASAAEQSEFQQLIEPPNTAQ